MKKKRGPRGSIIAVFLLGVLIFGGIYFLWGTATDIFQPVSASAAKPISIVVQENETVPQLANDLLAKGLIRNTLAFRAWAKIKGLDAHLQAGVYNNINPSMNISDMIDQFLNAQPEQLLVRIPEGWRLEQIATYLAGLGLPKFDKQAFLNYVKKPTTLPDYKTYPILKSIPHGDSMEGLLFPDTYYVAINATASDIIGMTLTELNDKIQANHLDTKAQANKLSVYQMIVLASIVERETSFDADRAKIASVYWNRIYRPNAETVGLLQSDPTVEYARDSQPGTTKYWGDLNNSGTGQMVAPTSPWNTYTHQGWPPTPISSPSLASLEAAASPAKTNFYFFLGRPDTGRAVFAETLAQFQALEKQYLPQ